MSQNQHPIQLFEEWWAAEKKQSTSLQSSACCLSTMGLDGFPNARFLSLKTILDERFVITGPLQSRKGQELLTNPRAALTFWWPTTQKHVRVQGIASQLEPARADQFFAQRSRTAQLISTFSRQGAPLEQPLDLEALDKEQPVVIDRPASWGGFYIEPVRIELMTFVRNRYHERYLFEKHDQWQTTTIQP